VTIIEEAPRRPTRRARGARAPRPESAIAAPRARVAATASGTGAARTGSLGAGAPGARASASALGPRSHARQRPGTANLSLLCAVVGLLSLVGLVMVLSASSVLSLQTYGSPWYYFERQLVWLALGAVAFTVGLRVDPRWWRRLAKVGMCLSLVLLFAVLVPGIGVSASGASRWIGTRSIQIQPSEFAKLALIFFAADVLDRRDDRAGWRYRMTPVLVVMGLLVVLVMLQPDMGTTMVLTFTGFAMLVTAGMPGRPIAGLIAGGIGMGGVLAVAAPYRMRRLTSFLHPLQNAQNTGFQEVQGLAGLSDGGLLGHGIGSSISSWGYLPNAQTDFIFAIIGEETGLVGSVVVAGLFATLAVVGIRIACRSRDGYLALVAAGITAWLTSQAIINIGAVVGILPVTGVPLPFVSFGGSSLVIALFATGVLAAIAKRP
jgi:cell division protein FtsW